MGSLKNSRPAVEKIRRKRRSLVNQEN
jgi:hypothetical protein